MWGWVSVLVSGWVSGLGFRLGFWGQGFEKDFGVRVSGSGFRVSGVRFRVGCRVGFRFGFRGKGFGSDFGASVSSWISGLEF
jgi:hypothetical protein